MSLDIVKLKTSELDAEIINQFSLWGKPDVLNSFAGRDNSIPYYICCTEGDKILSVLPIFELKKIFIRYISQALDYKYTPIYFFEDSLNKQLKINKAIGNFLKKNYFIVKLSLDPTITDIRGFKWGGCKAEPLYTYTQKINTYNSDDLPKETKRILYNKAKPYLNIVSEWNMDIYKELSVCMLKRKKREMRQIAPNYIDYLNYLYQAGYCEMFIAYKNDEPLGYLIIIKDNLKKYIYAFYAASDTKIKKNGSSLLCYDYVLNHFKNQFDVFDFCGANIETISYFKAQFNPDLITYYRLYL